jgi:hypothetical protein
MKKILLSSMVIAVMLFITCGTEPYEEFYEGTPEDSAAIMEMIADNSALETTDEIFKALYNAVATDPIEILESELFLRVDSPLIKQHVDSSGLELIDPPLEHYYDLWYAKDTTCTVFIRDTFNFYSLMHYDLRIIAHYDSAVIDTITLDTTGWTIGTIDTLEGDYADELVALGQGRRVVFFDVEREWVQDPDDPDDSVYAVREPIEWILKRVLYGTYDFPGASDDVPSITRIILTSMTTGEVDTIFRSSYDPDYFGHVMDRFRSVDSLLEYTDGEMLDVSMTIGNVDAADCAFFATCGTSDRIDLGTDTLVVTGDGLTNLYFEVVETSSYYYINPPKEYMATLWVIPVRVNAGGE